ncbi:hypothetical protein M011DRAFT_487039 [Sporormia fimetaria CBS 119925]|uniref:BTB domain-containing protein n=1 Tax=Sporormia fimetaria CBS 119925 TaxID=1340428 RepID=A0A6A6VAQ6_9PLEO|nr:hypothetical protein M011DRAFT_487039 [Sporormia fimetaria CBS 119925]
MSSTSTLPSRVSSIVSTMNMNTTSDNPSVFASQNQPSYHRSTADATDALCLPFVKAAAAALAHDKLPYEAVKELLSGPTVAIYSKGQLVYSHFPVRAFMAVSSLAFGNLAVNPTQQKVQFRRPEPCAMKLTLASILDTLPNIKFPVGQTFIQNLRLYEAALALGLTHNVRMYTNLLRDLVSARLLEYEELDECLKRLKLEDPVLQNVVYTLAFYRRMGYIRDVKALDAYLQKHSELEAALAAVDEDLS